MTERIHTNYDELSAEGQELQRIELGFKTYQELIDIAAIEALRLKSEMGQEVDPSFLADLIAKNTGVDFEIAALVTF